MDIRARTKLFQGAYRTAQDALTTVQIQRRAERQSGGLRADHTVQTAACRANLKPVDAGIRTHADQAAETRLSARPRWTFLTPTDANRRLRSSQCPEC